MAEDDAINRKVAVNLLEKYGYSVATAENGKRALEALAADSFDVVLMDVQMPEMDGFAATAAIRRLPGGLGTLPVIAMTAHALKGDREKCLQAGMDDYVSKPIKIQEVVETIEKWCRQKVRRKSATPAAPEAVGDRRKPAADEAESPIDLKNALEQTLGDGAFLKKLLLDFIAAAKELTADMARAAADGNGEDIHRDAHKIKGTAANLYIGQMSRIAASLEKAGRSGDLADVPPLLEDLKHEIGRVAEHIGKLPG